jgi:hypothetical protein
MINTILQTILNAYDNFVQTFGSPVVLLAISVTLVTLAIIELCVRKQAKCVREVR